LFDEGIRKSETVYDCIRIPSILKDSEHGTFLLLWAFLISQIMDSSRNYRTFLLCVINGHRQQRGGGWGDVAAIGRGSNSAGFQTDIKRAKVQKQRNNADRSVSPTFL
jgi:hypothetical protein